jgi:hypothetical protein
VIPLKSSAKQCNAVAQGRKGKGREGKGREGGVGVHLRGVTRKASHSFRIQVVCCRLPTELLIALAPEIVALAIELSS